MTAIFFVNRRNLNLRRLIQRLNFFLIQHPVFYVRDQGSDILQIALRRINLLRFLIDCGQNRRNPFLIREKRKSSPCRFPSIILNHPGADSINGTKLQAVCQILPKPTCKTLRHIFCRRHRVRYCQNFLRSNPPAKDHIAQACNQYRRFS